MPGERPDILGEVVHELRRRIQDIEDEICDELWGMDGYGKLTSPQREHVRTSVRRTTSIFLSHLDESEGDGLTDQERHFYQQVGVVRAWSGVPLDHLERGFNVGYRCAYAHLMRLAHQHGEAGAATAAMLSTRLAALYRQAWNTIEAGHRAASQGEIRPEDGDSRSLVTSVLTGTAEPDQLPHVRLRPSTAALPWDLVAVVAHPADGDVAAAADGLVNMPRPGAMRGLRSSSPVHHEPVLLPGSTNGHAATDGQSVEELACRHNVTFVVARSNGLSGLVSAYRTLERHLGLVAQLAARPGVVSARELMRHAILVDPSVDDAEWFARDVLGPLLGPGPSRWDPLATLYAVHDTGGAVDAAASRLGLAARTVRGHLARISGLLDVDPGSLASAYDIGVALRLLRIHADRLPAPDDAAWA